MEKTKSFSISARSKSFVYAFNGLRAFLNSEHNAWIHLLLTALAVVAGIFFSISAMEAIALAFAIGFVWVAELFNTSIEKTLDLITEEKHPRIGFIKDLAAGAVLIASAVALVTGLLIFIPKIISWTV